MLSLLLILAAPAAEAPSYARFDEPLRENTWRALSLVPYPHPIYRRRSGAFRVWTFPDNQIEHYEHVVSGALTTTRRLDAAGSPHTEVTWSDKGQAASVLVFGVTPIRIDTSTWTSHEVPHSTVTAWMPRGTINGPDGLSAHTDAGTWHVRVLPAADVTSSEMITDIEAGAGGVVFAAATTWMDGHAAARFTIDLPDPDEPKVSEIWAIPAGDHTLALVFTAPRGPDLITALAPGRAAAALVAID